MVPDIDEVVALPNLPGFYFGAVGDLVAVWNLGAVAAIAIKLPGMVRASNGFADYAAAMAQMGTHMGAEGIKHFGLATAGSKHAG